MNRAQRRAASSKKGEQYRGLRKVSSESAITSRKVKTGRKQ
mgnify:FL=1|tara:strand:+ start:424 stop:546 length:123 start_codon:yes stop_codon:yes gene_type:complete